MAVWFRSVYRAGENGHSTVAKVRMPVNPIPCGILNAKLLWFEVASSCFCHLLITRNMDLKALAKNALSNLSKIHFVRFEGSKFDDLLPEQRQFIDFKADFFTCVFVRHEQYAIV